MIDAEKADGSTPIKTDDRRQSEKADGSNANKGGRSVPGGRTKSTSRTRMVDVEKTGKSTPMRVDGQHHLR